MRRCVLALLSAVLLVTVSAQRQRQRDGDDGDSSFVITSIDRGQGNGASRGGSGSGGSFDRDSVGSSGDRFAPTNGRLTGNGGRGNGGRPGSSSSSGGGRDQFPDFVRIEVEIQRLENQGGLIASGKKCDIYRSCDPRLTAYLDTRSPISPWPGSVPVKQWPKIFEASNTNSPTIGKSLNVDICGGSVNQVKARVAAVDVDSVTSNDPLENFECLFEVDPRDISMDVNSARWGQSTECKSLSQPGKIRLFARQRAYQIPSTSCRATASSG